MATKRDDSAKDQGERTIEAGTEMTQQAAEAGQQAAEQGARAMRETSEQTARMGRDMAEQAAQIGRQAADQAIRQSQDMAQQQAEQLRDLMSAQTRAYSEVAESSRDDVDAILQSGQRLAKGMQDMGWEWMQWTQQNFRRSLRVANTLMECRSVEDLVAIQRDFMRESVDTLMNESARLLQMSSQVASDAVNPIHQRVASGQRGSGNGRQEARQEGGRGGRRGGGAEIFRGEGQQRPEMRQ